MCNPIAATGPKHIPSAEPTTVTSVSLLSDPAGTEGTICSSSCWICVKPTHSSFPQNLGDITVPRGTTEKDEITVCPGLETENWNSRGWSVWMTVRREVPGRPRDWTHFFHLLLCCLTSGCLPHQRETVPNPPQIPGRTGGELRGPVFSWMPPKANRAEPPISAKATGKHSLTLVCCRLITNGRSEIHSFALSIWFRERKVIKIMTAVDQPWAQQEISDMKWSQQCLPRWLPW